MSVTIIVGTEMEMYFLNKVQDTSKKLRADAAYLTDRLASVVNHLDEGYHVNSLGELQSTGSQFDQNCALREAMCEAAIRAGANPDQVVAASKGDGTWFSFRGES